MSGVFLSYSRRDRELAGRIVAGLRGRGFEVWWDEDMPGVDWQRELERKLNELGAIVVLWTESSADSQNVRDEARLGLRSGKLVNVTVGLDEPPFPFDRMNGLPLTGWNGAADHSGWIRLLATVSGLLAQPDVAAVKAPAMIAKRGPSARWAIPLGLGAVLVAGFLGWMAYLQQEAAAARRSTPEALRAAVQAYVASADCAWLTTEPVQTPHGATLRLGGLARDPAAVVRQVGGLLQDAGLRANIDGKDLNAVGPGACGPLNLFVKFRDPSAQSMLALPRSEFGMRDRPAGCDPNGGQQARTMSVLSVPAPADFTLLGMESDGRLQQVIADRGDFLAHIKANPKLFQSENGDLISYLCVDVHSVARSRLIIEVLVKGAAPFDLQPLNIDQADSLAVDADWQDRFWASAKAKGWTTQIAWFRVT